MEELAREFKNGGRDKPGFIPRVVEYIKKQGKELTALRKIKSNSASDEDVKKQLLNNILKAKTFLPGGDMPGKLKRKRKRSDIEGNDGKLCAFYVKRKHRCCHFLAAPGSKFCYVHTVDGTDRVKCPLNPNHTVPRKHLAAHLLRCNDRNKGSVNEEFYEKNINVSTVAQPTTNSIVDKQHKQKLTYEECLRVLNLLQDMIKYNESIKKFFPVKQQILNPKECESLFENKSNLKHVKQNSSIAGHVHRILNDEHSIEDPAPVASYDSDGTDTRTVVVEVGAGKGFLSLAVSKAVDDAKHYILVDNQHFRNRADKALRDSGAVVERQYIDLKDLCLERTQSLSIESNGQKTSKAPSSNSLVFVGKHVCGVATCYALHCAQRIASRERSIRLGGVAVATCCHHKCRWDHYTNRAFFKKHGFSAYDFHVMTRMSSWAVSGNHDHNRDGSLSVEKTKKSTKSKINAEIKQEDEEHWWSTEEKRRIGSICKTMMDVGRAFMFRDKGFAADIISYIDEETSMENRLLRVRAKKAMPNK